MTYLLSAPMMVLTICGDTRPTKPTIPRNPTITAVIRERTTITAVLNVSGSIPKLLALSSPAVSRLILEEAAMRTAIPIAVIVSIIGT